MSHDDIKVDTDLGGFTKMNTEEIKIEKIDIQPTNTYVSPEIKQRQQFKYFNNTYTYITIRPAFLKTEAGEKTNLRAFWNNDLLPWLQEAVKNDPDNKLFGDLDVSKIQL